MWDGGDIQTQLDSKKNLNFMHSQAKMQKSSDFP